MGLRGLILRFIEFVGGGEGRGGEGREISGGVLEVEGGVGMGFEEVDWKLEGG